MGPKAWAIRAGIAALIAALSFTARALGAAEPDRASEGAVVVVATTAHERGTGAGTIVAVAGDRVRVVTAKHVAVFGALAIRFSDGTLTTAPARIVSLVPDHDVAVVEATVDPAFAATLRVARLGTPRANERVHVRGSGFDGPDYEPAAILAPGQNLPDGPAAGRYELTCDLCHRGDSGAGVFDAGGALVGVYVGYWTYDTGARVSVAEVPTAAVHAAVSVPFGSAAIAAADANTERSTTSIVPATANAAAAGVAVRAIAARNVASISMESDAASASASHTPSIVPAEHSAAK